MVPSSNAVGIHLKLTRQNHASATMSFSGTTPTRIVHRYGTIGDKRAKFAKPVDSYTQVQPLTGTQYPQMITLCQVEDSKSSKTRTNIHINNVANATITNANMPVDTEEDTGSHRGK